MANCSNRLCPSKAVFQVGISIPRADAEGQDFDGQTGLFVCEYHKGKITVAHVLTESRKAQLEAMFRAKGYQVPHWPNAVLVFAA